ncbi:MAG TPA: MFS transporter [Salmonella bongori]|uniref:MFS transporter n=3 Tax=Salmonella bongori TaxID=54736 RepID=A0A248K944_SALBN|nr:MFS transporter [Salmonella bongori]ASG54310.1 MFS transporter [Salmonella bongori serovar 66:z41:- str. SA19983605]ECC9753915.1 MFS transporter [Salmonella bongori]EDP8564487.1 MFS transporter [Salmonella bongori]EDP8608283.1 MFS transporter [Salmonella bongori]EDP8651289.1 MFS transporter [Salmonella bongori]
MDNFVSPSPDKPRNTPEKYTVPGHHLPWSGLVALAMACFVTMLTEAMPAGLLLWISPDLGVSVSYSGQLVTLYAVGTLISAMPLVSLTQSMRRKPLLLVAIVGLAIINIITAFSHNYVLTLIARFLGGVFAGLVWSLAAGFAIRMSPPHLAGRAIAIAMLGTPLALTIGIPAGAYLAEFIGWRSDFMMMSVLTVILVAWIMVSVPDSPGAENDRSHLTLLQVAKVKGLIVVLFVTLTFILAHNTLFTYVASFFAYAGLSDNIDLVLLVFGVAALAGVWCAGITVDRWPRKSMLASIAVFAVSILCLVFVRQHGVIYVSVAAWGLAFGGAPTLLQAALAKTAGNAIDVAQSMMVTVWNVAISGGGLLGGILLGRLGIQSLPFAVEGLLVVTFVVAFNARQHGFTDVRKYPDK